LIVLTGTCARGQIALHTNHPFQTKAGLSEWSRLWAMATEPTNGRNVVVGLAVTVSRAGATAGRRVLWPARLVEGLPFVRGRVEELAATGREAELGSRRRIEGAAESLLAAPEAERALDHVLAGPLPESIGRSLAQHQVVERVARESLDEGQTARIVESVVASPEFEAALRRVLSSPAVRDALTHQTTSYGDEILAHLRQRAYRADARAERRPRAWANRPPRDLDAPYAGIASRAIAFAVDLLIVTTIFVTGSALAGLASGLVGGFRPQWLAVGIAGASALLLQIAYFAGFWAVAGQTPGMRLVRLRVRGPTGDHPGFGRALVRLGATWLALVPFCLGLVPVLVDDRRRALQDFIAGTIVAEDDLLPISAEAIAPPAQAAVPTASR
jgi:uncharacterized RDD family membrane protein YckC